jgi:cobalt-zinc-cadmium efflux system outer membrane protein
LKSAQYNRDALRANVALQRSQYYPNLFVGTDLRIVRTGTFLVGFTVPLFDFGGIHGAVKQAKKNAEAQDAQITLEEQQVRQDVETAFEALTVAEGSVEAFQGGMLPQAEGLEKRIEQGYVLGGNTILDLLDAQSTLRSARIAYYGAIGNYRQALAQLERAVGTPIEALKTAPAANPVEGGRKQP